MKVVLLHDELSETARPDELDVLVQADAVAEALAELGHTAIRLPFSLNLPATIRALRALEGDAVFNLVESPGGQGRLIYFAPAVLDLLALPYTGAPTEAMFLTSSKVLTKQLMATHGIATPAWLSSGERRPPVTAATSRCASRELPLPERYIIKPVWEDASVGIEDDAVVTVSDPDALDHEVRNRAEQLGREVFAEQYIEGREFNLSLLARDDGVDVLPPAEILFVDYPRYRPKVVGYRAKWDSRSFEYRHTPRSFKAADAGGPLMDELCDLARRCWETLGLRSYGRVDFRVDASGKPWVLEINANPCLSPDAGFAAAAEYAGIPFEKAIARILEEARRRSSENAGHRRATGETSATPTGDVS